MKLAFAIIAEYIDFSKQKYNACFICGEIVFFTGQRHAPVSICFEFDNRKHLEHFCILKIDEHAREVLQRFEISPENVDCKELHFGNTNCPLRLRSFLLNQGLCKPIIKFNGQTQLAKAIAYDMFYAAAGRPVHFNNAALNKAVDLACEGIRKVLQELQEEKDDFGSAIQRDTHATLARLFTSFQEHVSQADSHPVGQHDDKRVLVNKIMRISVVCSVNQQDIETTPAGWQRTQTGGLCCNLPQVNTTFGSCANSQQFFGRELATPEHAHCAYFVVRNDVVRRSPLVSGNRSNLLPSSPQSESPPPASPPNASQGNSSPLLPDAKAFLGYIPLHHLTPGLYNAAHSDGPSISQDDG